MELFLRHFLFDLTRMRYYVLIVVECIERLFTIESITYESKRIMFKIDASDCFALRRTLVHSYQVDHSFVSIVNQFQIRNKVTTLTSSLNAQMASNDAAALY